MPKAGGKWNTFDITAKGSHLTVTLNGVRTADGEDSKFPRGPIALQHGAARLVHDLEKLGIEMAEQRRGHRGQHARMDVTGPGTKKDARRRIQLAEMFHGMHPFRVCPKRGQGPSIRFMSP